MYMECLQDAYVLEMQTRVYILKYSVMYSVVIVISKVMLNTERLLKHAVQERLAVTICINKVRSGVTLIVYNLLGN